MSIGIYSPSPPTSIPPFPPSLISLVVSVDVKHNVYLPSYSNGRSFHSCGFSSEGTLYNLCLQYPTAGLFTNYTNPQRQINTLRSHYIQTHGGHRATSLTIYRHTAPTAPTSLTIYRHTAATAPTAVGFCGAVDVTFLQGSLSE